MADRPMTTVNFEELLGAYEWVSAGESMGAGAYVSLETGQVYLQASDDYGQEPLPDDVGDETRYVSVPGRRDLDLGNKLVFRYAEAHMPSSVDEVYRMFGSRGAYGRFKDLVIRLGKVDEWHSYRERATESALREWCEDNGLRPDP